MAQQSIAVALTIEDRLLDPLYDWGRRFDWSHVSDVHFIHVVKKNITPLEFGLVEMPDEKTYEEMRPTLEKFLRDEATKIVPTDFTGNVHFHLDRDFSPEEDMVEMLEKFHADLVVVASHGRKGLDKLFHSSFADEMIKRAPCDVYVVKSENRSA